MYLNFQENAKYPIFLLAGFNRAGKPKKKREVFKCAVKTGASGVVSHIDFMHSYGSDAQIVASFDAAKLEFSLVAGHHLREDKEIVFRQVARFLNAASAVELTGGVSDILSKIPQDLDSVELNAQRFALYADASILSL